MPSSDAFAFSRSGLNEFLFAPVGTEANGMTLSVVSVFARLGNDPWLEAGRLARLPKLEATESLARIIANMPASVWPLQSATAIAVRLVALLPTLSGKSGRVFQRQVFVRELVAFSGSRSCWCASDACWPIKPASSLHRTHQSLTRAASASRYRRPASRLTSEAHNRRPRRRDDRRDSRGLWGGSRRPCPWHWEGMVSAGDACRFPARARQSCTATSRATPRALPRLPLDRRTPPSDGLAGCRDTATSRHSSDFRRSCSRPAVPSDRFPRTEVHG